jgi:hypothetical protein
MKGLSKPTVGNKFFSKRDGRYSPVLEPNQIWDFSRGLGHSLGLLQRRCERLFAEYDLPSLGRGSHDGSMQTIGHGDIHNLDVRPRDYLLPCGFDFLPSSLCGHKLKLATVSPTDDL